MFFLDSSHLSDPHAFALALVREKWRATTGQDAIPAFLPVQLVAELLGFSQGGARNKISKNRFELPTVKVGGRRLIACPVLINFLVEKFGGVCATSCTPPADRGNSSSNEARSFSKRGRPSAPEAAEAANLGLTVHELRAIRAGGRPTKAEQMRKLRGAA